MKRNAYKALRSNFSEMILWFIIIQFDETYD